MRYVIYGAGGIGGAIGARLFTAGHEVVLIARGTHLDRMRAHGLRERTPAADVVHRIPVAGHPRELAIAADDVVLLTMKSQDTAAALDDLRAAGGDDVAVVCAQNGVENERMAARLFRRVYSMLVYLPATHLEPGEVVNHAAAAPGVLDVGCYPRGVDALAEQIAADLSGATFVCRPTADVMRLKYGKLLTNLANAVNALCPPGATTTELIQRARAEGRAVLAAAGIEAAGDREMQAVAALVPFGDVPGVTRAGSSSWQSLARGTGSIEADYLNGEIALLGRLHGVPTPVNAAVQHAAVRAATERAAPGSLAAETVLAAAQ